MWIVNVLHAIDLVHLLFPPVFLLLHFVFNLCLVLFVSVFVLLLAVPVVVAIEVFVEFAHGVHVALGRGLDAHVLHLFS